MSERLQVLFDPEELGEIRMVAESRHMTVSEWVRQALRDARREEPRRARREKLAIVESAYEHTLPTADIDQMLAEIAAGRTGIAVGDSAGSDDTA
jgi:Arc/MetJ-type ribon-helix-helix transcriptional regulator